MPQTTAPVNQQQPAQKKGVVGIIVSIVTLVVVLALVAVVWNFMQSKQDSSVDTDKYQAVFLTNGQVYFGKLTSLQGDYAKMTDIYYLQVQQSVQPASGAENNQEASEDSNSDISLNKLGNELHGPTDEMHIASEQILFWEDLKADSTVSKAIAEHKAQQ